jgi:hypothetical protein
MPDEEFCKKVGGEFAVVRPVPISKSVRARDVETTNTEGLHGVFKRRMRGT